MTATLTPPTFTCGELRAALRACAAGATVVTTTGDEPYGIAAGPFTAASIEPPVVLGSVTAAAARTVERSGVFAVNVLPAAQEWLSHRFTGTPDGTVFDDLAWMPGKTAAPVLLDARFTLECELTLTFEAGSETLIVGEVRGLARVS